MKKITIHLALLVLVWIAIMPKSNYSKTEEISDTATQLWLWWIDENQPLPKRP